MKAEDTLPWITNDAVILGLLMIILGFVFATKSSDSSFWKTFYSFVPALLLCYFIPSILNTFGIIDGNSSNLYFVASRYLLPSCLVLLTLSIDFKALKKLGSKALIMFLTGTVGIVIGGPISILIFSNLAPDLIGISNDQLWRGMTTLAGSWIGGGANQTAMKELFEASDFVFSKMIVIDVAIANAWLAALLIGVGKATKIDKFLKADSSAVQGIIESIEKNKKANSKAIEFSDLILIAAVGFGATGIAHFMADMIAPFIEATYPSLKVYSLTSRFFWMIILATTFGLLFSFTKLRNLEPLGASKIGNVFLYVLIASIGMKMDILAIFESPGLFLIGIVWMLIHVSLLIIVAKIIRAPFFFVAVGSQANVGGAASAPVVASAFHPSLAPVGVLLAVMGYALGTYAAYVCGLIMQLAVS